MTRTFVRKERHATLPDRDRRQRPPRPADDVDDPPVRGGGGRPVRPRPDARHHAPLDRPGGRRPPAPACALRDDDAITSTHRGHGHCIAKGADLDADDGRAAGARRPATAGAAAARCTSPTSPPATSAPTASSAAASRSPPAPRSAYQLRGDGPRRRLLLRRRRRPTRARSTRRVNLAAIWKLPVVFICENNKYGMSFSTEKSMRDRQHRRARGRLRHPGRDASTATTSRPCTRPCTQAVDARPRRRRPDARRERDLPLEGPLQVRQEPLPHHARRSPSGGTRTRSCRFEAAVRERGLLSRRGDRRRSAPRPWRTIRDAVRAANAAPDADPSDLLDAVFAPA